MALKDIGIPYHGTEDSFIAGWLRPLIVIEFRLLALKSNNWIHFDMARCRVSFIPSSFFFFVFLFFLSCDLELVLS
jgi:hypothetical protein